MIDRLVDHSDHISNASRGARSRDRGQRDDGRGRGGRGGGRGPKRRRGALRTWLYALGALMTFFVLAGTVFAIFAVGYVIRVTEGLPEIADLESYEPPVMSRVHAGDGRLIAEYARESRVFVPIETIPPDLVHAFVAAEDKNFYNHDGIAPMGMLRAQIRNVRNWVQGVEAPLQGGSTITQQVAKNFKLEATQTIERKVREIALAFRIEEAFSKDEILELYLNEIYLGRRAYGVAAAALLYFNKPLDDLTLSEMAYLAGVPRGPNNYHPIYNKDRAIARRNYVLGRMADDGYITEEEAELASRDDLIVSDRLTGSAYQAAEYFVEDVRRFAFSTYGEEDLYDGGLSLRTTLDSELQVAARRALRDGLERYDRRHGYRGPITQIETGNGWEERLIAVEAQADLDADWAKAVVLRAGAESLEIGFLSGERGEIPVSELAWARRVRDDRSLGPQIEEASQALNVGDVIYAAPLGPDPETGAEREGQFGLMQIPEVNGGIIALDPHTGRILAMVGGYSYRLSQFNRANQARRQPGSSFKPFVYAAALDNGYTPVSQVLDGPYVSTDGDDGGFYKPSNYVDRWYGMSTLRLGIELSRNMMTLRLANDMGLEHMSEYGERFGIYDDLPPYVAMALGAGETTLMRMATAYAELVNGGLEIEPTIVDRVQARDGSTIYRHDQRECIGCNYEEEVIDWENVEPPRLTDPRERVVDAVTAYQIVSILQGVVERGTARSAMADLDWTLAGKTGTSNDFKDAWFMGFSPDLVVGVYVGFDTPRSLGNGESGGVVAAPIFHDFMAAALEGQPDIPFRTPPGVQLVPVNGRTGELGRVGDPETIWEAFRPGTAPTRYASTTTGYRNERPRSGISIAGPNDVQRPSGAGEVLVYDELPSDYFAGQADVSEGSPLQYAPGDPSGGAPGFVGAETGGTSVPGLRGDEAPSSGDVQTFESPSAVQGSGQTGSAQGAARPPAVSDSQTGTAARPVVDPGASETPQGEQPAPEQNGLSSFLDQLQDPSSSPDQPAPGAAEPESDSGLGGIY
ncbi:MAG: PBP1A family penicillin-binding protein [Maricaulaceae bacterium]|jgi:penicillin-binding protein 1A